VHRRRSRLVHYVDNDEADCHQYCRDPEGWLSSPALGEEEYVCADHDELLRSEEAGDEEILTSAAHEDFEELRTCAFILSAEVVGIHSVFIHLTYQNKPEQSFQYTAGPKRCQKQEQDGTYSLAPATPAS
jgi:hypothetical protein